MNSRRSQPCEAVRDLDRPSRPAFPRQGSLEELISHPALLWPFLISSIVIISTSATNTRGCFGLNTLLSVQKAHRGETGRRKKKKSCNKTLVSVRHARNPSPDERPATASGISPRRAGKLPRDGARPGPHAAARSAGLTARPAAQTGGRRPPSRTPPARLPPAGRRLLEPAETRPAGQSQPSGGRPRPGVPHATPRRPPVPRPASAGRLPQPPQRPPCGGDGTAGQAPPHRPPAQPRGSAAGAAAAHLTTSPRLASPCRGAPRRAGTRRPGPQLPQPPAPAARESGDSRRHRGKGRGGQGRAGLGWGGEERPGRRVRARRKSGGRSGSPRPGLGPGPPPPPGAPGLRERGAGARAGAGVAPRVGRGPPGGGCRPRPVPPAPPPEERPGSAAGSGLRRTRAPTPACGKPPGTSSICCPPLQPAFSVRAAEAEPLASASAEVQISSPDRRRWSFWKATCGKS